MTPNDDLHSGIQKKKKRKTMKLIARNNIMKTEVTFPYV